ncbi:site-specific integrase [Colwellia sp. BRX10-6]|uniref:tyrosine-type recombinase/integrase n=1 Tax=unclassified Colwellia TaxID=196834 RepID=UPI0015F37F3C|nr:MULTISPECIES: site-specific integrase [unclassified Colwellia]MBA6383645.1 site-specific integrase [Colwellia sp. BRX10-9]MBA6394355.1 site-specific integrase [Colwellia sp. BRX10-6]
MPLSDKQLMSLHKKPQMKVIEVADRDSLSVRVSPKGKVVFQYRYRFQGNASRYDLGSYPTLSLKNARIELIELKRILEGGHDIKVYKREEEEGKAAHLNEPNLAACVEEFLDKYNCIGKQTTREHYEYSMRRHVKEAPLKPVHLLSKKEWVNYFDTIGTNSTPTNAQGMVKKFKTCLNFLEDRGFIPSHMLTIKTSSIGSPANKRDRTPTIEEIKQIFTELDRSQRNPTTINTIKALALTGARNGEIRQMEKKDIDLDKKIWILPAIKHKSGFAVKRPLNDEVIDIIKWQLNTFGDLTDYVFPNGAYKNPITPQTINKTCRAIIEKLNMEPWTVHDFRRSLSTTLVDSGVELHVAEKMLGHTLGGILSVYNKSEYIKEQRTAYAAWGKLIIS